VPRLGEAEFEALVERIARTRVRWDDGGYGLRGGNA
jgi:hypothetical protein